uniref:Uncharacterized protein n=1 Tax=Panagrolaimus davidi TaxID=227884 RepID=A0A914QWM5_9BILA
MSLYFEERMKEQKEDDPENDKIVFSFPWILQFPMQPPPHHPNGENEIRLRERFTTAYAFENASWYLFFSRNIIRLENYNNNGPAQCRVWNGTCFISYNLFYDVDMR